jgi:antitoxin component of RelBE/YafQ-DinJ toxin-antitoxin module
MPDTSRVHLVMTARQQAVLDKLCRKLMLGRSEVMRMALARLAEAEGIPLLGTKSPSPK